MKKNTVFLINKGKKFISIAPGVIGVIAGIFLLIKGSPVDWLGVFAFIFFMSFVFFGFFIYINIVVSREINKAVKILDDKCDPEEFLDIINEFEPVIDNKKMKAMLLVNKTAGLLSLGKHGEGIKLLESIDTSKLNAPFEIVYYNNFAGVCIKIKEFEKAKINLDKVESLLIQNKIDGKIKKKLENIYKINKVFWNMCNKKFDGCMETLNEILAEADFMRAEIEIKFALGFYYMNNGDMAKAKECFAFVIANGNKLYVVEEAREYLAAL
ncbi:MAG: hypothetical protein FWF95_07745 [Syntrophorhabdaceae bacterium]|nr:hypothetical protein [Syntrophorhabdaceae bacterium]